MESVKYKIYQLVYISRYNIITNNCTCKICILIMSSSRYVQSYSAVFRYRLQCRKPCILNLFLIVSLVLYRLLSHVFSFNYQMSIFTEISEILPEILRTDSMLMSIKMHVSYDRSQISLDLLALLSCPCSQKNLKQLVYVRLLLLIWVNGVELFRFLSYQPECYSSGIKPTLCFFLFFIKQNLTVIDWLHFELYQVLCYGEYTDSAVVILPFPVRDC